QECSRAGAMDAIIVDRFFRRLFDGGMRSEAEVILRGKVHPPKTAAGVVFGGANGLWRLVRGLGIRPVAIAAPQILPSVKLFHTFEEVWALGVAILAQAPCQ